MPGEDGLGGGKVGPAGDEVIVGFAFLHPVREAGCDAGAGVQEEPVFLHPRDKAGPVAEQGLVGHGNDALSGGRLVGGKEAGVDQCIEQCLRLRGAGEGGVEGAAAGRLAAFLEGDELLAEAIKGALGISGQGGENRFRTGADRALQPAEFLIGAEGEQAPVRALFVELLQGVGEQRQRRRIL